MLDSDPVGCGATFINVNSPNETISNADHNQFITHPTFMDPNDGDIFHHMIVSGFYDYWYQHQLMQPFVEVHSVMDRVSDWCIPHLQKYTVMYEYEV